jgi:uncharacterized protein (DUF1810 family)
MVDVLSLILTAQNRRSRAQVTSYEQALQEIRKGCKRSHWIWWIFPCWAQIRKTSRPQYSLPNLSTAQAFLRHPVLAERLSEITLEATRHLRAGDRGLLLKLFGLIDAEKFVETMTFFAVAAIENHDDLKRDVFCAGLKEAAGRLDANTMDAIVNIEKLKSYTGRTLADLTALHLHEQGSSREPEIDEKNEEMNRDIAPKVNVVRIWNSGYRGQNGTKNTVPSNNFRNKSTNRDNNNRISLRSPEVRATQSSRVVANATEPQRPLGIPKERQTSVRRLEPMSRGRQQRPIERAVPSVASNHLQRSQARPLRNARQTQEPNRTAKARDPRPRYVPTRPRTHQAVEDFERSNSKPPRTILETVQQASARGVKVPSRLSQIGDASVSQRDRSPERPRQFDRNQRGR